MSKNYYQPRPLLAARSDSSPSLLVEFRSMSALRTPLGVSAIRTKCCICCRRRSYASTSAKKVRSRLYEAARPVAVIASLLFG